MKNTIASCLLTFLFSTAFSMEQQNQYDQQKQDLPPVQLTTSEMNKKIEYTARAMKRRSSGLFIPQNIIDGLEPAAAQKAILHNATQPEKK